jgi:hypothetical protein
MEIRKMSQSELDLAIKQELERVGGYDAWCKKGMAQRGITQAAAASNTGQKPAVCRRVQIARRVSWRLTRTVIQAGTRALRELPPARARRIS